MKQTKQATVVQKNLSITIPICRRRDVKFLHDIEKAHDYNSLARISGEIERAFKTRIEDKFLEEDITPKTRADITGFFQYLLDISKFYGYSIENNKLITTIHDEMLTIRTSPAGKITSFLDAVFTYFDKEGHYRLAASGLMRCDWASAPDNPASRRDQIKRDNNDMIPGLDYGDNADNFHIHVEIKGQFPLLVLPVDKSITS
jgi:hypothetical protein